MTITTARRHLGARASLLLPALLLLSVPALDALAQRSTHTKELRAETTVGSRTVAIEGRAMALEVRPGEGDQAVVEARLEYWSDDEDWMQAIAEDYDVVISERGSRLTIDFTEVPERKRSRGLLRRLFGGENTSWSLDVLVTLPSGTFLEVENAYGSIDVEGLDADVRVTNTSGGVHLRDVASVEVENSYAPVEVVDASGNVTVASTSAPVHITDVAGDVRARSSYSEMRITDVQGDVDADMSSGQLEIRDVQGNVHSRNSYGAAVVAGVEGELDHETSSGEVEIANVQGHVRAANSYGALEVSDVGAVDLRNPSGAVTVLDADGPVTIVNSYAPVLVTRVDGDVRIDSASAGVEVREVDGGVDVKTSYDGVDVDGVAGPVRIRNSSGRVSVSGFQDAALGAEHTIQTSYAGIEVVWPAGADVAIEARSTYGSIESELGGAIESSGARQTLLRDGSGARLSLVTSSGSIRIRVR